MIISYADLKKKPWLLKGLAGVTAREAAAKTPKKTTIGGDAGYQGIQDDLLDHSVITPFKKWKLHPLTDEQKLLNQEFARGRIVVENTLCQFKQFRVLAARFRHDVDTSTTMPFGQCWLLSIRAFSSGSLRRQLPNSGLGWGKFALPPYFAGTLLKNSTGWQAS